MNKIYFVGDTHGGIDAGKLILLSRKEKLSYSDFVVICGDFGGVWDKETLQISKDFWNSFKTNILFVDGNHENFDMLEKYPISEWCGGKVHFIDNHIIHLMRGQVFNIFGKKIFTMGGADSADEFFRQPGETFWEQEAITDQDVEEGKRNLEKVDFKVDYIVTHNPPLAIIERLKEVLVSAKVDFPYHLIGKMERTKSNFLLDWFFKNVKFDLWFCGHLHMDEYISKTYVLYDQIKCIDCRTKKYAVKDF